MHLPLRTVLSNHRISVSTTRHWLEQNTLLWLRPLLIIGVLLGSVFLVLRPLRGSYDTTIILLVGASALPVLVLLPPLGPALVIVASLIVPFAIATGSQTEIHAGVLLLALLLGLWIVKMMQQDNARLLPSRPIRPLLLLIGVAILSFLVGNQRWLLFAEPAPLRAQVGGLGVFLLSAGACLLVAHQVRELRWLRWLTQIFLVLGSLFVVGRLIPEVGRFTSRLFQPGAYGSLFWIWLVALALGQALFNRFIGWGWRLGLIGVVIGVFYLNYFVGRGWTSGWLPPLVAAVTVLLVAKPKLSLPAVLLGGAIAAVQLGEIAGVVMMGDNEYSLMTRLEAWHIMAEIIKINPILGLGPANYYWYTPLFPILGYTVNFNSHNNYIDILAQTGLLGLACFVWFAWEIGRLGWWLRTRVPEGFARAYVYGALGGLAGTLMAAMLGDWVLPFVYNIGLSGFRASVLGWLFLGGLIALERIITEGEVPVQGVSA